MNPSGPEIDELTKTLARILVNSLELGIDASELDADTQLIDELGLDSAAVLELIAGIEEAYDLDFDVAGTTADDFRSIRSLAHYVQSLTGGRSGGTP